MTATDDVEAQQNALPLWNQHYSQLSCGSFQGKTTEIDFGEVRLFREEINAKVEQIYAPPAGTYTFSMFVSRPSLVAGIEFNDMHFGMLRGGRECHAVTAEGASSIFAVIDHDRLFQDEDAPRTDHRLPPVWSSPETPAVMWWLSSILACYSSATAPVTDMDAPDILADMIVDACRNLIRSRHDVDRHDRRRAAYHALVLGARDIVLGSPQDSPSTDHLANALRVSPRLLEDAFHSILGMGPATWLRLFRLNQAHCDLRHADDSTCRIADIATRWGFWHLGRFSGYYRTLFGHTPSETLRRTQEAPRPH